MYAIRIKSAVYYLRRKKLIAVEQVPRPIYETGTPHPHERPVTLAPWLRPVDSPGTKVLTGDM